MSLVQEMYDQTAAEYRAADELHIKGDDYLRVRQVLTRISGSFPHPIDVLDLGCGAGRYFHCLTNVNSLLGVDISQRMLDAAQRPVKADEICTSNISLRCSDLMALRLPKDSLDFIYCVGVFGNGCDLTPSLVQNIFGWLRGGGKFFFDCFAEETFPEKVAQRKKLKAAIYSRLPNSLRQAWDRKTGWPPLFLNTPAKIQARLRGAGFDVESLQTVEALSPLGQVKKIECVAVAPR
ncbi:MAG TPA: methyltransferase domain-containing protein [Methylomirabilota bacterium]|nr:methyltransferase domain-containing protein [Methylomirabilota bacterium]